MRVGPIAPAIDLSGAFGNQWLYQLPGAAPMESLPDCATIQEVLERRCDATPDRLAYRFLTDGEDAELSITYSELRVRAERLAENLRAATEPGSSVLLFFPPGFEYLIGYFACLYAGRAAVSGLPPHVPRAASEGRHARRLERIIGVLESGRVSAVLGEMNLLKHLSAALDAQGYGSKRLEWIALSSSPRAVESAPAAHSAVPSTIGLIQYTSGSTTEARGVVIGQAQLMHNLGVQARAFELRPEDVMVSWLPLSHDMGLIFGALAPLYVGFPAIMLSPTHFVERPARWLRAITNHCGTVSAAPSFAYDLCCRKISQKEEDGLELAQWRFALNAAEPISPRAVTQFIDRFGRHGFREEAMRPGYGLAEATLAVSARRSGAALSVVPVSRLALGLSRAAPLDESTDLSFTKVMSCGAVAPEVQVVVVGDGGSVLPDGQVGEVFVSGPSVASGYFEQPERTAEVFGLRLGNSGQQSYLATGDLGFFLGGELFITGRKKDVLIFRGINYYPNDIERAIEESCEAVSPGGSVAFSVLEEEVERLVVLCEIARAQRLLADGLASQIRRIVFEEFGLSAQTVGLLAPASLPKTPSGKIQRALARRLFERAELPMLVESRAAQPSVRLSAEGAEPERSEEGIRAWLCRRLGVGGAQTEGHAETLSDLGLDSERIIELAADVQQTFGIRLDASELFALQGVGQISTAISSRLEEKYSKARSAGYEIDALAPHRWRLRSQRDARRATQSHAQPGRADA